MRRVVFNVHLFTGPQQRALSEAVLRCMLNTLTAANIALLKSKPTLPTVYQAGIPYRAEKPRIKGQPIPEEWNDIETCLRQGWADCEDLACWLVADLLTGRDPRFRGRRIPARTDFSWRPVIGPGGRPLSLYHIFVRLPGGRKEDPSARLGMPVSA